MDPAGSHNPPQPAPPPKLPNVGAWSQNPNGSWTWNPGATPDPNLVNQYGNGALTDPRRDPSGNLNHGAWTPVHGGGWAWTWGANPDPNLAKTYGTGALTDPTKTPNGAKGPGDPNSPDHPAAPDVVSPTLNDTWGGKAPDVTGNLPSDGNPPQQVSQPPNHPAFRVSPGSIRNAEQTLLAQTDTQIGSYNDLKAYVAQTGSQNLFSDGMSEPQLMSMQDNLLQHIGDAVELVGQFTSMLNYAAQNYAHADVGSFIPQS